MRFVVVSEVRRWTQGLLVLACAAGPAWAETPTCETTLDVIEQRQLDGPRCFVAAVGSAVTARGAVLDLQQLARSVPIWKDGIDPFDMQQALSKLGWESLVFTGPPEAPARLVEAGFAVVAFVDPVGSARHTVTLTGVRRRSTAEGDCTTALQALRVMDPRTGTSTWQSAQSFAARQSAQQLMVLFSPDERPRLSEKGFPIAAAVLVDSRFRAEAARTQ